MNLSPEWVPFLTGSGFDNAHWVDVGVPSAPDSEILEYASEHGFVILTHDLDYGALVANRESRQPSMLQVRSQDVLPSAIGQTVVRALRAAAAHLEAGALVTVEPGRNRIRLLPIKPADH